VFAALVAGAASGADIWRWVDEAGKVHYGDTVPDKYKSVAKQVHAEDAVSDEDRRAAAERANREKGKVMELRSAREAGAQTPPTPPSDQPKQSSCDARWQAYLDNAACYAPFHVANGGLREGALETCGPTVQEPQNCGTAPNKLLQ
jgi:hypothetical protein